MNDSITLRNDFHGSEIRVRVPTNGRISATTYQRIRRTLCGVADCKCGHVRGPQTADDGRSVAVTLYERDQGRPDLGRYFLDLTF